MRTWSIILIFCISAFCADTVYVEQIIRDTVYIPIKSRTDTIYIKKDIPSSEQAAPKTCCTPTERNPLGADTTKFLRYDTSYTHHTFYLNFDFISFLWIIGDSTLTSVGGNLEVATSRKNSLMVNFRYSKRRPTISGSTFNDIYTGYIAQYDIGLGYRHYFRPSKYSFYLDVGGNWLFRKHDYINKWDENPNLYNDRPHSRHETATLFAPYLHGGHIFRGNRTTFGLEYGFAYNATDKELLKKEISYITGGLQLDLRINFGVGVL